MSIFDFNLPKEVDFYTMVTSELQKTKRKLEKRRAELDKLNFRYQSREHFEFMKLNELIASAREELSSRKGKPSPYTNR